MSVLVSACGSRWCIEPVVARAVRLRARGTEVRVCAPLDEGCDRLVMRGVMPVGGWR